MLLNKLDYNSDCVFRRRRTFPCVCAREEVVSVAAYWESIDHGKVGKSVFLQRYWIGVYGVQVYWVRPRFLVLPIIFKLEVVLVLLGIWKFCKAKETLGLWVISPLGARFKSQRAHPGSFRVCTIVDRLLREWYTTRACVILNSRNKRYKAHMRLFHKSKYSSFVTFIRGWG